MKDDLGETGSYSIPQNNKIKVKSTQNDFGDDLIWPINFLPIKLRQTVHLSFLFCFVFF